MENPAEVHFLRVRPHHLLRAHLTRTPHARWQLQGFTRA